MAFVAWPANLPVPEAPFSGELVKPLDFSSSTDLGAFESTRRFTRGVIKGTATLYLDNNSTPSLSQFAILRTFWRDTLNDGQAYFTADWPLDIGFKGYIVRMPTFSIATTGSLPTAKLDLEFKPFVRLSNDGTLPSPWPSRSNS